MKTAKMIVPCLAIVCLTILEIVALLNGVDGALFSGVIIVIGGIAGYKIKGMRIGFKWPGQK